MELILIKLASLTLIIRNTSFFHQFKLALTDSESAFSAFSNAAMILLITLRSRKLRGRESGAISRQFNYLLLS